MSSSSNDDDEPKVCTVFASSSPSKSKTVFDTIAFAAPKKDVSSPPNLATDKAPTPSVTQPDSSPQVSDTSILGQTASTKPVDLFSSNEPQTSISELPNTSTTPLSFGNSPSIPTFDAEQTIFIPLEDPGTSTGDPGNMEIVDELPPPVDIFEDGSKNQKSGDCTNKEVKVEFTTADTQKEITQAMEGLILEVKVDKDDASLPPKQQTQQGQGEGGASQLNEDLESPIPTANSLFADAPDVPFPVGTFQEPSLDPQQLFFAPTASSDPPILNSNFGQQQPNLFPSNPNQHKDLPPLIVQGRLTPNKPLDTFSTLTFSPIDAAYDAWIPKETTRKILMSIATAVHSGTYFPDKLHMTTPGIIYEDDLIDKVGVNMGRIFGEAEASKRRILNADSVTQDDNGLRELIKLGCYRSAINLTKRLLTLYGQGPGKVGQFSKHNPHTLQLWFTRITLLVRIREFAIAESEIDAFKDFDNPDLYYEYYPDSFGGGRKGSMVPFNFRLLAAEILQYSRKHNETIDRLLKIVFIVQQILKNVDEGMAEDGSGVTIEGERKSSSSDIWRKREIRVYYSLANASLFSKDYQNTFKYLTLLCQKDKSKEPQLKSSIGRLFLQLGDLTTAGKYFREAAELRPGDSDKEQVENLIDSAMISIAQGAYPEAFALLQQAVLIQPDNFVITNNMAVCLLYMGKVKDSLALMETTVKNNTPELLQENVLLNLSTIYELENTDGHKKNALLKLVSQYKGDGINLASLKMPNLI